MHFQSLETRRNNNKEIEFLHLSLVGFQSIKMILRVSANRFLLEPDEIEESLVYRSLRDIIVPGIKPKDLPLFNSIIDDLFPKTTKNISNYEWLREAFEANCKENGCESAALVYQKLCEMYEMSVYRKGIALIGNPCTGKSFVLRTLAAAIATKNHISVNEMDIGIGISFFFFGIGFFAIQMTLIKSKIYRFKYHFRICKSKSDQLKTFIR